LRRYETIFILRPDLGEAAHQETIKRFAGLVASNGGDLIDSEEWGFRELAYRIRGEQRGFYVRLDYGGNGATMNEVERNLKLSDNILRYLSVLVDDDVDPAAVRTELEANRRRSAEARAAAEAARAAADAAREAAAAERAAAAQATKDEMAESSAEIGEDSSETDGDDQN
jgi:small subunit ribosomal protein S6